MRTVSRTSRSRVHRRQRDGAGDMSGQGGDGVGRACKLQRFACAWSTGACLGLSWDEFEVFVIFVAACRLWLPKLGRDADSDRAALAWLLSRLVLGQLSDVTSDVFGAAN